MNYSFLPFHEIAAEYIPNTPRWYQEIIDPDVYALDVDWDYYLQASVAGYCFAVTMRDDDNLLQGHAVYMVMNNPRHKTILQAVSDAVFVEEPFRGSAPALLKFAHSTLEKMGVKTIQYTWSDKRLGELLSKLGCEPTHTVWAKKLGELNG